MRPKSNAQRDDLSDVLTRNSGVFQMRKNPSVTDFIMGNITRFGEKEKMKILHVQNITFCGTMF